MVVAIGRRVSGFMTGGSGRAAVMSRLMSALMSALMSGLPA
jgi:hypothetical protein